MTLQLDARQRAMLAEMGVPVFFPEPGEEALDIAEAVTMEAVEEDVISSASTMAPQAAVPPAKVVPIRSRTPPALPVQARGIESMEWDVLAQAVAACRACGLGSSRRNAVFGIGDLYPDVLVIGEPPDENEDRQGEPSGGPAGQLLDNMLRAIGVGRGNKAYIANVLKCRPPAGRRPLAEETAECEPMLRRQVQLLKPKVILAMGRFAVETILRTDEPLGRLRGRAHSYEGVPVVVTYHPAYLLGNLPDKAKAWTDLCFARELISGSGSA